LHGGKFIPRHEHHPGAFVNGGNFGLVTLGVGPENDVVPQAEDFKPPEWQRQFPAGEHQW
jgi:hypothetical protein